MKRRRQQHPFNPLLHHCHHTSPAAAASESTKATARPRHLPKQSTLLPSHKQALCACFNNLHSYRRLLKKFKKIQSKVTQEDTCEANFLPASGCYSLARNPARSPTWPRASGHLFAHLIQEFWCTGRTLHSHWSNPSPYCVHLLTVDLHSVRV